MNRLDYLKSKSDYDSQNRWFAKHIDTTNVPPVKFTIDGKCSCTFNWEKTVEKLHTVTDFENTDMPVKRSWYMIIYTDKELGLQVRLKVTSYPDYPVVEYEGHIVNISDKNSPVIKDIRSIKTDIMSGVESLNVNYIKGSYNLVGEYNEDEFHPYLDTIVNGSDNNTLHIEATNGKPTSTFFPCFNLENRNESKGIISVMGWAGKWAKEVCIKDGTVSLEEGEYKTELALLPGEKFRTPIAVLLFYKGEASDGQNMYRRWLYEHNIMRYTGKRYDKPTMGICIGDIYPGMKGNAADDILNARKLKETGLTDVIDEFVQDAGWYDCDLYDWAYTGNWHPAPNRYPEGLGPVGDAVHESGLKYHVWFEPERIFTWTDETIALRDAVIALKDENGLPIQKLAWVLDTGEYEKKEPWEIGNFETVNVDYSNKKALEYTIEFVNKNISEGHIDIYRQDYNILAGPYWDANDKAMARELGIPRTGVTEEKHTTGYMKLWQSIVERHPGIIIDSCAGGGMRNDLETMRYSYPHTRTDFWERLENTQCHTMGAAQWLVCMGGTSPQFANPANVENFDSYQWRTEMLTSAMIGLNFVKEVSDETIAKLKEAVIKWKDVAQYVYYDFYNLTEWNMAHDCVLAMQYDKPELNKGLVMIYERPEAEGRFTIYPTHLENDAIYTVMDMDDGSTFKISGKDFMKNGITVEAHKTRVAKEFRYSI